MKDFNENATLRATLKVKIATSWLTYWKVVHHYEVMAVWFQIDWVGNEVVSMWINKKLNFC